MRHVQAVTFLITLFSTPTSAFYAKVRWFSDDACTSNLLDLDVLYQHSTATPLCHPFGKDGTKSIIIELLTGPAQATFMQVYDSADCTGTPSHIIAKNDLNTCKTGRFSFVAASVTEPTTGSKMKKRISYGTACEIHSVEAPVILEVTNNFCYTAPRYTLGDNPKFAFVKFISKAISGSNDATERDLITESYYSDNLCTVLTWASPVIMDQGCITQKAGTGPDFSCTSAPCGSSYSTTGVSTAFDLHSSVHADRIKVVNYAKFRFYQDQMCKLPTTYVDDPAMAVVGRPSYNGANVGQTGSMNTDGTFFKVGEQVYDGNAPGQVMYLPVNEDGSASCTQVELGNHAATINSISCTGTNAYPVASSATECSMHVSTDCTGGAVSSIRRQTFIVTTSTGGWANGDVITGEDSAAQATIVYAESATSLVITNWVGVFQANEIISTQATKGTFVSAPSDCDATIFAKVEDFKIGFEQIKNSFSLLKFAEAGAGVLSLPGSPRLAQECGGKPYILQGILDTCQVNADISKGHTWNTPNLKARCSLDWDTQYAAATRTKSVTACQALCYSDVECLAIAWGRDGYDNNHKCVLCKDVTLAGHAEWDTHTKTVTPPFTKVTTGTFTPSTYQTSFYTTSDCTGQGLTAFNRINMASTCRSTTARATAGRAALDVGLGSILLSSAMPPALLVTTVLSQGLMAPGDAAATDQLGCPNVMNYVYTEGLYTMLPNTAAQQHRVCAVLFQGPPGTTLSFEWPSFSLTTGACVAATSDTPRECACTTESVVIKDGLEATAQQVGQPMCGSFAPQRILFSGNTARIDFEAVDRASAFSVHVNHHYTKVAMHLPPNPTYALGSDIAIPWSIESSFGGWAECGTGTSEQSEMHGVGRKTPGDEQWQRRYECARSSHSDHGWIGIYRNGTCEDGARVPHASDPNDPSDVHVGFRSNAYTSGQQPHECYLGYRSIPMKETRGTVIFKYTEDYQTAGWYSLRYFSGDASGTVCEVIATSMATDPEHTKDQQCLFSPITRGQIYISTDRSTFSGNTQRKNLPGYELTLNE